MIKENTNKTNGMKIISMLMLLVTSMIWGFAFVAQKVGAESLGAFSFNGIRFSLGAISLVPVVIIFERKQLNASKFKKTFFVSVLAGSVLYIASALQQYGIEITKSAGKAGFITGLYTVLVPIFSFVIYRQRKNIGVWVGAIVAVVGLFLLSVNDSFSLGVGDAVLLLGAVFWAVHILVIDRFVDGVSPLCFSMLQFFVCAILSIISAIIFESPSLTAVMEAKAPLLYGGLCSVGIAYTLQTIGQKYSDPSFAAIIFSTESVFSAIGGALILKEQMILRGYLGCVLIFAGIIISQITFGKKKQTNKAIDS